MPAACESSVGLGRFDMSVCSHIANAAASPLVRRLGNEIARLNSLNANMARTDRQEVNAGPNFLGDWLEYRGLKQAAVADTAGVSKAMMSDLVNGKRAMTAAYMQRFAKILDCRPGDIIDFHPHDVPPELRKVLKYASPAERDKVAAVAEAMLKYDVPEAKTASRR